MNIKRRILNCYAMKQSKEAANILEAIAMQLTKDVDKWPIVSIKNEKPLKEKDLELIQKKIYRVAELTLAIVELEFNKWDMTLELANSMPDMEI